jgi:hypothetical protein
MLSQSGVNCYMLSAMDSNVTALERAFQLAKSGECGTVSDLKQRLRSEGYSSTQLSGGGGTLLRQFKALIKAARDESHAQGT